MATIQIPKKNRAAIINSTKAQWVRLRLVLSLFWIVAKQLGNPIKAMQQVNQMRRFRSRAQGNARLSKFIKSEGKYYWATDYAAFPSSNFNNLIKQEWIRQSKSTDKDEQQRLPQQTLIWSITNRCGLKCKHCYDWENSDSKDHLSLSELMVIAEKVHSYGIRHVQLSGGEPLNRFHDLVTLIEKYSGEIDFWLLTSAFDLTQEKSITLKKAGLKGVQISLDHWDKSLHNAFRQHQQSFDWVVEAVGNCKKANILVSLSLCATREFVTHENIEAYANLAKSLGVQFIRILEPRSVGRFALQNVSLSNDQLQLLSDFSIKMNSDKQYRHYPIVNYPGYHQRRLGCMGAGNRYFYIDANGEVHACPFCQSSVGNVMTAPIETLVSTLRHHGCLAFSSF